MTDYGKRADPIVHEEEPFTAETGLASLAESPLTATDAFYVRGHGAVPEIDPATWRIHVGGKSSGSWIFRFSRCMRRSGSAR